MGAVFMASSLSPNAALATPLHKPQTDNTAASPKADSCAVRQFKTLALTTHDTQEREKTAVNWLKNSGPACSLAQISFLSSNSAQWLGTADSVRISALFEELIDAKSHEFVGEKPATTPARADAATSAEGRPKGPNGPTTVVPPPAANPALVATAPPPAPPPAPAAGASATPSAPK
jgi:hypothetical protein